MEHQSSEYIVLKTNDIFEMVFRVINNDATKLTDKLTLFRKSLTDIRRDLKNGVGARSFTSIVTSKDVSLLKNFNNAIQSGTDYTKAFETYLSKVPISIKKQGNELIQLNNQMLKLKNAYKTGKISKQAYSTQMNILKGRVNSVIDSTKALTTSERIATGITKGLGVALNLAFNVGLGIAINLLTTAIYKAINYQKEFDEKTKELADNIHQEKEEIKDLYKQYVDISKEYAVDKSKKEDLIKITDDLLEKLGHEKTTIQELIDEYGNLDDAIQNITYESLKEKRGTLSNARLVAENELKSKYKSIDKNTLNNYENFIRGHIGWQRFWDDIGGDFLEEYRRWYQKSFSVENAEKFIEDTNEFISKLEDSYYQDELEKIKIYSALVTARDDLKESLDNYNASVDDVNKNEAEMVIALARIGTEIPKTQVEFNDFKNGIIDTVLASDDMKKHFVGNEKDVERAIASVFKEMPEFAEFFAEDLPDSTDKSTLSVKKLTDAYEKLSEVLDDLLSKQDKLADLYEKIAKGTELSASEAYKLIDEFPELTNYLVRVGSKWSFDIKGVNSAFDKLEDDFAQKAQEIIDNNKKVIEQSFDDYYAENTKLSFDGFMSEKGINTISINSASDYEKFKNLQEEFNEQVLEDRNKLLEAYEKRQEAANDALKNAIALQQLLNSQINDFDFDVDNYNDKIKELMDASEKMAESEALSYEELVSLIDKFPDLTYSGENGEYFIEKSALDELIEKSYEERNARIDDEIAKTYAVNEEVANRVKAYEDEKERIEKTIAENRKKYDESYDNPDLTEGILERIELTAEQSKLIKELNALDKEQYEADKALMESQSEYSEAYRKYLEALKGKLTSGSKSNSLSKELQNEIDYYGTIIKAIEAVTDKEIEALEDKKDALKKQKDALKDANDEQQRELDLIKARNNLENAKKRKVYVYTEGSGFQQTLDKKSVKEAEEKLRDVELDIQEANIDKQIDKLDEQIDAFEDYKKQFTDMKSDIEDLVAIEKAKNALELDEQGLLNLPPETAKEIQEGLAEAVLKKDKEDNKDNKEYEKFGDVAFDDFLKKLGTPLTSDEVYKKWTESMLNSFSSPPELLRSVAENISNSSEVYNNNSKKEVTFAPNINVYGVSNPEEVKNTVRDELTEFFREFRDSVI